MKKLKSFLYGIHGVAPFYLVIILLLVDIIFRYKIINNFNFIEWLMYLNSILLINELLKIFLKLSFNKLKQVRIFPFIITLTTVVAIFLLTLVSYGCFFYFGLLPNKGIISYVFNEPLSTWVLVKEYIQLWHLLFTVTGIGVILYLIINNSKSLVLKRKNILVNTGICLFALVSIVNTAQRFDQSGLPASQTLTSSLDYLFINPEENKTRTLVKTGSMKVPPTEEPADFNIILIINESVRRSSLQIYNDKIKTTPKLCEFKEKYKHNFYQFEWARTNATLTFLSVPSILNGLSPYADKNLWLAAPLLWDYAKAASLETFFVSSHCFNWGGWKNYLLQSENIDYSYTECDFTCNEGDKSYHPLGIGDDSIFIDRMITHIDSLNVRGGQNFCGVLHLYGPHAPYWYKGENKKIKGNSREIDYYNSIYQQDLSLSELWEYLEEKELLDNTVILYTSDHGEAFGERNVNGHLTRYFEEVVGIPIWIYLPNSLSQHINKSVINDNLKKNISNIDLLPTIVELLEIPISKELFSKDGGNSLFQKIHKKRKVLITNYNYMNYSRFDKSYCLVVDSLKYMYRMVNDKLDVSIYNFISDPKEKINVNESNKKVVEINYELLKSL